MADVKILLIEGIFGMPSVFLLGLIFLRLLRIVPPYFKEYRLRASLALLLVIACSVGVLGYAIVFAVEFYELKTCHGAGCAQGGLGTFIATPFAWLSLALTWSVSHAIFSPKYFPHLSEQQESNHA